MMLARQDTTQRMLTLQVLLREVRHTDAQTQTERGRSSREARACLQHCEASHSAGRVAKEGPEDARESVRRLGRVAMINGFVHFLPVPHHIASVPHLARRPRVPGIAPVQLPAAQHTRAGVEALPMAAVGLRALEGNKVQGAAHAQDSALGPAHDGVALWDEEEREDGEVPRGLQQSHSTEPHEVFQQLRHGRWLVVRWACLMPAQTDKGRPCDGMSICFA